MVNEYGSFPFSAKTSVEPLQNFSSLNIFCFIEKQFNRQELEMMFYCHILVFNKILINPDFMRDLFKLRFTNRPVREKYKMNMIIPEFNQVSYGKKSLRTFGPKLWNSLPYHIKSSENLESFKRTIKHWNGERCLCKVCNCS